jgi:type I restriction enzyme S subunit
MSELPSGWSIVALSDVCKLPEQLIPHADKVLTYIDITSIDRALKKVSKPQQLLGADAPSRARKLVEKGDVLVSMTRPNLNAVALIGDQHDGCIASTGFDVLKPIEVDPRWIFSAVRSISFVNAMCSKVQGALYPAVKSADIREYEIPLPPLAEQNRISQKLDELLTQVDTLKARIDGIPALLKRFRQSVLTAAVSGRLTEEWRCERNIPNCSEVELGLLIKEGPQNGLYKPSSAYGTGVKIIRIDSFYSGEIKDLEGLRSLAVDQCELEKWGVKVGDILINRVNSIEYLGKCALVRSAPEPTVFESNVMRMSLRTDMVSPEYLMRYLSSEIGRKRLISKAKHAVNQASINQGDVKACKIPLPSLTEQNEIVKLVERFFAFAEVLEDKVDSAKSRIDHLTQSILAKAFRGELMPQDPNDEPASALLERIQAQRAAAPKVKRGRKST